MSYKDKLVMESSKVAAELLKQRIPKDIARCQKALDDAASKGWNGVRNVFTCEIKTHDEAAAVLRHFTEQDIPGRYVFEDVFERFIFEFDWSPDGEKNMAAKDTCQLLCALVSLAFMFFLAIACVIGIYHVR